MKTKSYIEKTDYWLRVSSLTILLLMAMTIQSYSEDSQQGPIVRFKDARIKIETNATDSDAGIQVFIDVDTWKSIKIYDPNEKLIFQSVASGSLARQGGTELYFESAEPDFSELPFEEFLKRFPQGVYKFRGVGLEGESLVGNATLTHNVPKGPRLVSPLKGGPLQDPNNTVLTWKPVPPANGSPIIAYQVLVIQTNSPFKAIPKFTLDIMMPANATRLKVPPGFLLPDTEYEWEVLAIEEGGNQTLSTSLFTTAP
jgi:hypothetical protein